MARRNLTELGRDRSGASALFVGMSMVTVLGFIGLGVDVGSAYVARRAAQNAADSAAYSAATAQMAGAPDVAAQARAVAAGYGLKHGQEGVQVLVATPAAWGGKGADPKAVEVIVERPARRFFSGFFADGARTIRARAVGRAGTTGKACVIALHATASASALETGSADVNLAGCSLFSNSSSQTALELKGAATLTADSVGLVGGYALSNNGSINVKNGIQTNQQPIEDPYKDLPIPSFSGCDFSGGDLPAGTYSSSPSDPFVFCNGVTINSRVSVKLNPGIYIVDRGLFQVNGGATLTGTGVTIVLTSSTGSGYATLHINGNAYVDLTAPTSGPTAGLVFDQDRRAPSGGDNIFNGGSTQRLQGAIYFPSQTVTFSGGASTATSGCTQILASMVAFKGNSTLGVNCDGTGVKMAGGAATVLVE